MVQKGSYQCRVDASRLVHGDWAGGRPVGGPMGLFKSITAQVCVPTCMPAQKLLPTPHHKPTMPARAARVWPELCAPSPPSPVSCMLVRRQNMCAHARIDAPRRGPGVCARARGRIWQQM